MLRRNWRRFIPIYAILPLVTTGLMNLFAYQLPKLIQLLLHSARSFDLPRALDVQFPFPLDPLLRRVGRHSLPQ